MVSRLRWKHSPATLTYWKIECTDEERKFLKLQAKTLGLDEDAIIESWYNSPYVYFVFSRMKVQDSLFNILLTNILSATIAMFMMRSVNYILETQQSKEGIREDDARMRLVLNGCFH